MAAQPIAGLEAQENKFLSGGNNPYETLGIDQNADGEAIKKAYRQKAKETHPDRNRDNPDAEENFKSVSTAYNMLSDANKRAAVDSYLNSTAQADSMGQRSQNDAGAAIVSTAVVSSPNPISSANLGSPVNTSAPSGATTSPTAASNTPSEPEATAPAPEPETGGKAKNPQVTKTAAAKNSAGEDEMGKHQSAEMQLMLMLLEMMMEMQKAAFDKIVGLIKNASSTSPQENNPAEEKENTLADSNNAIPTNDEPAPLQQMLSGSPQDTATNDAITVQLPSSDSQPQALPESPIMLEAPQVETISSSQLMLTDASGYDKQVSGTRSNNEADPDLENEAQTAFSMSARG
ncbi:molecular chaperone DnaJ (plasmid) [Legionella adelaidensis]|uniref:Molecular chaperone DnaJ n=1 Tax=Legionella adelaidensis TaxID=45056 RepID=A0A0W0R2Q1_9GAMM|nr:J domain-containing protein [Legionella adelaidensis]KTC65291.1 molecular chaperone DnaJ [Legionella adelaidensis]VEH86000.1 molecular chaperone DnaJ [Legionella adelaidensis]